MLSKVIILIFLLSLGLLSCTDKKANIKLPWYEHGKLIVEKDSRIIVHEDGTPFLWLGCTAWGMTEWLTREDVDLYLDNRKSKGINVVQICLFWGKRVDYPTKFTSNASNPYGHKAFAETDGFPEPDNIAIVEGGSTDNPNDYWDHVDYCFDAIKKRGMYAAVLPFWGRRYVNASLKGQSLPVFTLKNIFQYGEFLGERYGSEPNIIWVNGGDVKADENGDFLKHYRLFAEGLGKGVSGSNIKWDNDSRLWDSSFMTYHPDGNPMINSSKWFHHDPWLDFNMIETHVSRNKLPDAIRQDMALKPVKPTVLAEGHYEGVTNKKTARAIHIRRQAYQTFFLGAAGHTYGGGFDEKGNGPLFSPSNNWKHLLNWEGAGQLIYLRNFLEKNKWWTWKPTLEFIIEGQGEGELEKLAIISENKILVYFPENSKCTLNVQNIKSVIWFNTSNGEFINGDINDKKIFNPPSGIEDCVLVLNR